MNGRTAYLARLVLAAVCHNERILPATIKPELVSLELTGRCNSRCLICDFWRAPTDDQISTERAVKLLDELHALGVRYIRLGGGEPLLRKDLFDILATQPRGRFSRVVLSTNGLLLGRLSDRINDSIVTHISASLDGLQETNDYLRGIPGCFDTVLAGLAKIHGKKIKIVTTLTSRIIPDLEKLILSCRDLGYELDFNILSTDLPFHNKSLDGLMIRKDQLNRLSEILNKYEFLNKLFISKIMNYLEFKTFFTKHCILGYYFVIIDPTGSVKPGCYLGSSAGNINEFSLAEIISSKRWLLDAKEAFNLRCPKCTCGYGINLVFENPLRNLPYAVKRLLFRSAFPK